MKNSLPAETLIRNYDPATYRMRTFLDVRDSFLEGSDSPRDYLERCMECIDSRETQVKAWVVLNLENARQAADESGKRYRQGMPLSVIDGMPLGIKDVLQTRDMPTELGSPIFKGRETNLDTASVNALRLAGGVILGKTVTTEFAFVKPGPTTNPFDPQATPGGSSSGTSAAVGAGMIPAGLGNQVVGSVIRPASYCGNFAIKPTIGALHNGEGLSLSQLHLGVHAASLPDMWAVAYQIANRAGSDPGYPGLYGPEKICDPQKPRRLIVLKTEGWDDCDEKTKDAFLELLESLKAQGVKLIHRSDDKSVEHFETSILGSVILCRIICSYEMRWLLRNYHATGLLSEDLKQWLDLAEEMSLQDYRESLQKRDEMRKALQALSPLAEGLITLSSPGPAPSLGHLVDSGEPEFAYKTGNPSFNAATSALGLPCITLPLLGIDGMPTGIQLMGQHHTDWNLTGYASWMMQTLKPISA